MGHDDNFVTQMFPALRPYYDATLPTGAVMLAPADGTALTPTEVAEAWKDAGASDVTRRWKETFQGPIAGFQGGPRLRIPPASSTTLGRVGATLARFGTVGAIIGGGLLAVAAFTARNEATVVQTRGARNKDYWEGGEKNPSLNALIFNHFPLHTFTKRCQDEAGLPETIASWDASGTHPARWGPDSTENWLAADDLIKSIALTPDFKLQNIDSDAQICPEGQSLQLPQGLDREKCEEFRAAGFASRREYAVRQELNRTHLFRFLRRAQLRQQLDGYLAEVKRLEQSVFDYLRQFCQ